MKFAHLADCHIGAWREPKLRELNIKAFNKAINSCISEKVDFILIAGDLFNTSLPAIDYLKKTVANLKKLKDKNIQVYIIAGSHDFSPSGKTILDVLGKAGLVINVVKGNVIDEKLKLKFTIDEKTGAKITGMIGKRGMLERTYYENLIKENLEQEQGFKIFMLHTALTEFKPKDLDKMDSSPLSLLPKGFNYYAAGHVHYVFEKDQENYGLIAYPGPIFPNNFKEIEKLERGGYYLYDDSLKEKLQWKAIQVINLFKIKIDVNHKTPQEVQLEIEKKLEGKEFINTLITIRCYGTLKSGKTSDINFKEVFRKAYDRGAYFIMKNTTKLTTQEFEEIKFESSGVDEIEDNLIKEHLGQFELKHWDEEKITKEFIKLLDKQRLDGEKVNDFEKRLKEEIKDSLGF